jgi:hypothetical protein
MPAGVNFLRHSVPEGRRIIIFLLFLFSSWKCLGDNAHAKLF